MKKNVPNGLRCERRDNPFIRIQKSRDAFTRSYSDPLRLSKTFNECVCGARAGEAPRHGDENAGAPPLRSAPRGDIANRWQVIIELQKRLLWYLTSLQTKWPAGRSATGAPPPSPASPRFWSCAGPNKCAPQYLSRPPRLCVSTLQYSISPRVVC